MKNNQGFEYSGTEIIVEEEEEEETSSMRDDDFNNRSPSPVKS
jgi:hypothetical protein